MFAELARDWELSELALDDNDFLCLQTADGAVVNIDYFEQDAALAFYTTVGRVPDDGGEIYQILLEGNCDWAETAGGTLALDPSSEFVLLTAKLHAETLDLDRIVQQIETLTTTAADWATFMESLVEGAPGEESQEPADFA